MSGTLKIKLPGTKPAKKSGSSTPQAEPHPLSKKKRKLTSEDEDYEYSARKRVQHSESEDRPDDEEIDVTGLEFDDGAPLPHVTSPRQLSSSPPPRRASQKLATAPKRKKKTNVVYSDNEDEDEEEERDPRPSHSRDGQDDDFVPPSSPLGSSKLMKKTSISGKLKLKRTASKGGGSNIVVRDERKATSVEAGSSAGGSSQALGGTKRPRKDRDEEAIDEPETLPAPSSTVQEVAPVSEEQPSVPKKRKLPTIKKNKPPVTATPTSGISTPVGLTATAKVGTAATVLGTNPQAARKPAATAGNAEVDLMNSDVYNSLFKSAGGTTPKSGLNRREKEEERRKELDRMRDQARAARLADLESNSFDLLAAQEKVTRFEAMLKERNSVALFPHHLASYLKHKTL